MNIDFLYNIDDTGRHNLVLVKCNHNSHDSLNSTIDNFRSAGVNVINIGRELSEKLKMVKSQKFLTIEAQEYLHELIESHAQQIVPGKPKVTAIYNLGILLEPVLSLNAVNILMEISKNITIIILWEHLYANGILHWGIQQEQYQFNLTGIYIAEGLI